MAEPQGFRQNGPARVAGPLAVEEVAERLGITIEQVLQQYRRIAFTSLHDIVEWDNAGMKLKTDADTTAVIEMVSSASTGRPYRIKLHDKKAVLDALGRAIGVFPKGAPAPSEEQPIDIDAQSARERLIAELDRLADERGEPSSAAEAQR
jgi:hypothetical protein